MVIDSIGVIGQLFDCFVIVQFQLEVIVFVNVEGVGQVVFFGGGLMFYFYGSVIYLIQEGGVFFSVKFVVFLLIGLIGSQGVWLDGFFIF